MIQADIEGYNFLVPNNLGGQQAYASTDHEDIPYVVVAFKPSKEDMDAFNRGDVIYIRSFGPVVVPMVAYTINEKGEVNI